MSCVDSSSLNNNSPREEDRRGIFVEFPAAFLGRGGRAVDLVIVILIRLQTSEIENWLGGSSCTVEGQHGSMDDGERVQMEPELMTVVLSLSAYLHALSHDK
jgi:hypothetical protein